MYLELDNTEAVARRCSVKKGFLKNFAKFTSKHLFLNKVVGLRLKKRDLAQVFSCKFCEIFEHLIL